MRYRRSAAPGRKDRTAVATTTLTPDTHDATVADGIVLIDFWADWCGPCKQFAPVFEKASEEHPDITFAKVDTEADQELAGAYGIQSIPTLVVYRDGIPVYGQPGALPAAALEDLIRQVKELDMDEIKQKYAEHQAAEHDAHDHGPGHEGHDHGAQQA
jgi:thioredoxin 1